MTITASTCFWKEHAVQRGSDGHKGKQAGVQGDIYPAQSADSWSSGHGASVEEPEPACLLLPNHVPAPNIADRGHNQALMRIFRVSPGPAPRPPRLLLLGM